jgi:hypothetical protein
VPIVYYLNADVQNGGFDQYFHNTAGELVDEAIDGYRALGLGRQADVVERANAVFVRNKGRSAGRDPDLDVLDKEYYAATSSPESPGRSTVLVALVRYVRTHLAILAEFTAAGS